MKETLVLTCFILKCLIILCVESKDVKIAVLLPGHDIFYGECIRAAVQMAIDDVSRLSYINQNGTIHNLTANYQQVSRNFSDVMFNVNRMVSEPDTIAILGSPYYEQTSIVSDLASGYTYPKPVFSYSSKSLSMTRGRRYLLELSPTVYSMITATPHLMRRFGWTKAAVLMDASDNEYNALMSSIKSVLTNFTIVSQERIFSLPAPLSVSQEMDRMMLKGSRVIFALIGWRGARKVFCEAHKREMTSPKVTWILFETLEEGWAGSSHDPTSGREVSCSEEEILKAADNYISFTKIFLRKDGKVQSSVTRRNTSSFVDTLNAYIANFISTDVNKVNAIKNCPLDTSYAYDAVQTVAFFYKKYLNSEKYGTLYKSERRFYAIVQTLGDHISLEGVTGSIDFKRVLELSQRRGEFKIYSNKMQQNAPLVVGLYNAQEDNLIFERQANKILFNNGRVPRDSAKFVVRVVAFNKKLSWSMWGLAMTGIVFTIVVFILNTVYNFKNGLNDVSTPIIDHLMFFGCILSYISVIVYGLDVKHVDRSWIPHMCMLYIILLTIGFSLASGSMLAKIWQLYKVCMTNTEIKEVTKVAEVYFVLTSFKNMRFLIYTFKYGKLRKNIFSLLEQPTSMDHSLLFQVRGPKN